MKATKIRMKTGYEYSAKVTEISEIYIEGCTNPGFFLKSTLYDFIKSNPCSIQVNIYPYPSLIPALSSNGEKYVRSEPNDTPYDNLLKLPRCQISKQFMKHGDERCRPRVLFLYKSIRTILYFLSESIS